MARQTFGDVGESRQNNFDFLRCLMASLVVYAHSFALVNGKSLMGNDPLARLTKWQEAYGGLAVKCFFMISGYLITRSWLYSKGPRDYFNKRALRIIPALAASLVFCVFIIGPLATHHLSEYFKDYRTYRFLGIMFAPRMEPWDRLPGVFTTNPLPGEVNGPLWTIRYEILCYIMVAALGILGIYKNRRIVLGLGLMALTMHMLGDDVFDIIHLGLARNLMMLVTFFYAGMVVYLYRDRIPYSPWLFCAAVAAIVISATFGKLPYIMPVVYPYVLFYIAFSRRLGLQNFAKHGDLSYGIYVYAFPIQQLLVTWFPGELTVHLHVFASLSLAAICAALSWRYIEYPFLQLKKPHAAVREPAVQREPVSSAT